MWSKFAHFPYAISMEFWQIFFISWGNGWVVAGRIFPWSSRWRSVLMLQMIAICCCHYSQWPSSQSPSLPRLIDITSLQQQLWQQRVLVPSSRVLTRSCSWRHSALHHLLMLAVVMLHHKFLPPPVLLSLSAHNCNNATRLLISSSSSFLPPPPPPPQLTKDSPRGGAG